MRGKNLYLNLPSVLQRASQVENTGAYTLEQGLNGGNDPSAHWPYFDNDTPNKTSLMGTADCVGVGMWIQGLDRYQPQISYYGGWVNTNSVFGMPELFDNLGQDFNAVKPGDALVYPSYRDLLGRKHYGHWMTVVSNLVPGKGGDLLTARKATKLSELTVVHCSQRKAPATRKTPGFAKGKSSSWAFFRPVWR